MSYKTVKRGVIMVKIDELHRNKKLILHILCNMNRMVTTGELYGEYKRFCIEKNRKYMGERGFRRVISKLNDMKIIDATLVYRGNGKGKGNTKEIIITEESRDYLLKNPKIRI